MSKTKFKAGDAVIRINESIYSVIVGNTYIVKAVEGSGSILRLKETGLLYFPYNFKLAEEDVTSVTTVDE